MTRKRSGIAKAQSPATRPDQVPEPSPCANRLPWLRGIARWWPPSLWILFSVVLLDYVAQIPYYLINYLFRYGVPPSVSAVVLLGLTLAWFLLGFIATRAGKVYGFWLLLSFAIVEGLFYLHTILSGAAGFQLSNPNSAVKVVFMIGYLCGLVSLGYALALLRYRGHYLSHPGRG